MPPPQERGFVVDIPTIKGVMRQTQDALRANEQARIDSLLKDVFDETVEPSPIRGGVQRALIGLYFLGDGQTMETNYGNNRVS